MKRLRDYQLTTVSVPGKLERECTLIAVDGDQAYLHPHATVTGLGSPRPGTLRFEDGSGRRPVLLVGWVFEGELAGSLVFLPRDTGWMRGRETTPTLPLTVDAVVAGQLEERGNRTLELSGVRVTFVDPLPAALDERVGLELTLPGRPEVARLRGRVESPHAARLDSGDARRDLAAYILRCRQQIAEWAADKHLARSDDPTAQQASRQP